MKRTLLLIATALLSLNLFAMDLQQAKAEGLVGEQLNGYLGLVKNTPEANALKDDINAKRRAQYEKIAAKNKITTSEVAKLAADKAIKAAESGHYVQDAAGKWIQK